MSIEVMESISRYEWCWRVIQVQGEQGHSEQRVSSIQALSMKKGELDPGTDKR